MSDDERKSVTMADEPASLDIFQTVFPVVATVPDRETELERPDFFGTALAIAGPTPQGMIGGAKVVHREVWREREVPCCIARRPRARP